jgi:alkanesulfonate monooxygenase SsuD/methylene tetrahydromethanopterin reductase-like flavin-dependent oxidoreductase (luciferase family)
VGVGGSPQSVLRIVYVGSAETVATKIARTIRTLDVGRFDMIYSAAGTVSSSARLRSVELYGTQVIPRVRELLAERRVPEAVR